MSREALASSLSRRPGRARLSSAVPLCFSQAASRFGPMSSPGASASAAKTSCARADRCHHDRSKTPAARSSTCRAFVTRSFVTRVPGASELLPRTGRSTRSWLAPPRGARRLQDALKEKKGLAYLDLVAVIQYTQADGHPFDMSAVETVEVLQLEL